MTTPDSMEQKLREARRYFEDRDLLLSPPIKRAAYSDRMAWLLSSIAHLVYDKFEAGGETRELLVEKLRGGGFELVDEFNEPSTDTQAFLVVNPRHQFAVLAFRGTEVTSRKDLSTDAMVLKIPSIEEKVRIHGGFQNAYNSVSERIEKSLLEKASGMPLYITGHSLGAALATVATLSLERKKYFRDQIAACYTYGSPRVGTRELDIDFKSPIYRVVNTTDVVTMVPTLGYRHVGDVRFFVNRSGVILRSVPVTERLLFILRAAILKLFAPLVGDHAILEYRSKLEAVARKRNDPKRMGR